MPTIDLNCDLGESFGVYNLGRDAEMLAMVSSASIACGFHAGDPAVMRRTVEAALAAGVAIGAHPGLPDLAGFGRRAMAIAPAETRDLVLYQVGALEAFVRAAGGRLRHVKPHGALYAMAAGDRELARAIAAAVRQFDPALVLFGLSGSELIRAGEEAGLRTASEVFADRTYRADGTLMPRSLPGALIEDAEQSARRVARMVTAGTVEAADGREVAICARTVCLHGDGPRAVEFARSIREKLAALGIQVRAFQP